MPKLQEIPLLFRKRPFGVSPFCELGMPDKGCLIDENICLELDIPINHLRYQKFTLVPGLVSRCVGDIKITTQQIQNGKIGNSVQFFGKVIRNLNKMTGIEAISDKKLSNKLFDFPVLDSTKPKANVKNWLSKHFNNEDFKSENSSFQTTYPSGTATFSQCKCDWSNAATNSSLSTKCCAHQGFCQKCKNKLRDITDFSSCCHDTNEKDIDKSECSDHLSDDNDDSFDSSSLQSYGKEYDPIEYENKLQEKKVRLEEKYGIEYDNVEYEEKKERIENRILRVRSRNNAWLGQHRIEGNKKFPSFKSKPSKDRDILEECFPGGAAAADAILPRLLENINQPNNIVHSVQTLNRKKEKKKTNHASMSSSY